MGLGGLLKAIAVLQLSATSSSAVHLPRKTLTWRRFVVELQSTVTSTLPLAAVLNGTAFNTSNFPIDPVPCVTTVVTGCGGGVGVDEVGLLPPPPQAASIATIVNPKTVRPANRLIFVTPPDPRRCSCVHDLGGAFALTWQRHALPTPGTRPRTSKGANLIDAPNAGSVDDSTQGCPRWTTGFRRAVVRRRRTVGDPGGVQRDHAIRLSAWSVSGRSDRAEGLTPGSDRTIRCGL